MKKNKTILILVIVFFLTLAVISHAYFFYTILDIEEFPMMLLVGNKIGIDVGVDMIRFGRVQPGGGSSRIFYLTNDYDFPIVVKMSTSGILANYVSLSANNFVLAPLEKKEVSISAGVPKDMAYGNYTGKLKVVLKRE
ncbi:MAG: hypothetical protein U9Q69_02620 [Nanoarchaeota archaeon]|nr:hypothetical protein [Nanoarchaeota archaeon]